MSSSPTNSVALAKPTRPARFHVSASHRPPTTCHPSPESVHYPSKPRNPIPNARRLPRPPPPAASSMSALPRVRPLPAIPLLTSHPFAFTLSNLTAHFSSLTPLAPSSPRRACPELAEGRGPSGIQPPGRFQLPRPPLHTERTALFLPYPRAHRPGPFRPIWTGPNTPQNRQKSAPRRLKSFLEKTLTARETPNSPPPKTARSQTPHHSGSASSSLALWVRVFRSKRCPAAPAGASTPIRRRPTVPNPAHLAATTGDNRMVAPLPRRTR